MLHYLRIVRATAGLVLAACIAALVAAPIQAQEMKLTVGTSMPPIIPLATMLTNHLKPKVEQLSDGKVKMDVHLRGTLCNEGSCMDQVRLGQIDIATISTANYGGYWTTFEITTLPYIFKDETNAEKVFGDFLVETLKAQAAEKEASRFWRWCQFSAYAICSTPATSSARRATSASASSA